MTRQLARDSSGRPLPDTRVYGVVPPDGDRVELMVSNPETAWGRAGLRTADAIVALNGRPVETAAAFRAALAAARVNDILTVDYRRADAPGRARVVLSAYTTVQVTLEDLPRRSARQRATYAKWTAGLW